MENKIPTGIKILGIGEVILGLICALSFIIYLQDGSYKSALLRLSLSIVFIILGIGMLQLRNTARIGCCIVIIIAGVFFSLFYLFLGMALFHGNFFVNFLEAAVIIFLVCFIFIRPIYMYLNSSKVKEQFK